MSDPNRTQMAPAPTVDPNRTVMGSAPTLNATQTIKPVQCPVCKTFNPAGMMFCVECGLIFERALPDDAFGAPAVKLPCLVEQSGREHPIRPGVNLIGREGDVTISDGKVSRKHAQILSEDGGMVLEDLGSTNGTLLNGDKVAPGERRALNAGDTVSFGGVELKLSFPGAAGATQMVSGNRTAAMPAAPSAGGEPSSLGAPTSVGEASASSPAGGELSSLGAPTSVGEVAASALAGGAPSSLGAPTSVGEVAAPAPDFEPAAYLVCGDQELPLRAGANSFGRKAENDVALADPYVSGKHGQIDVEDDAIFFTDLGSTNGTLLNGARLSTNMRTKIVEGDEITIGSLTISFRRATGGSAPNA